MIHDWSATPNAPKGKQATKGKTRNREPIVLELVDRIISQKIAVGGHLPTENELVEEFAVSRTVVREVTHDLISLGLIETRPRVGARVLATKHWDRLNPTVLDAMLKYGLDADLYEPLVEARALIEPEVAAMAAARAAASDIDRIEAAFEGLTVFADRSPEDRIAADIRFHRAILEACGNWVFQRFGPLFDAVITARMTLATQSAKDDPPFAIAKHQRIVNAIKDRNPGEARKAALSVLALSKTSFADYFRDDEKP